MESDRELKRNGEEGMRRRGREGGEGEGKVGSQSRNGNDKIHPF